MERTVDSISSTDERSRAPQGAERIRLGHVVGAHGVRGELRVRSDAESLSSTREVWLAPDGTSEVPRSFEVRDVRAGRTGECRLSLEGVLDRGDAAGLKGHAIFVRASELPPLAPDEYYAFQLEGCSVVDMEGSVVGRVARIWETGAQDLLVVTAADGREHLVPWVSPILQSVDVAAGRVTIDPPPGLLDAPSEA